MPIDAEILPPMWGRSYWWTRAGALLGLAALLAGALMTNRLAAHLGSCGLEDQLTSPTLAIEVAPAWADVVQIVGPCQAPHCLQSGSVSACPPGAACQLVCPDKIRALAVEQYWDYALIVAYWLFFLYLSLINWRFCSYAIGRIGAVVCAIAATAGALADWRENGAILAALHALPTIPAHPPLMRDFAYTKWQFLFVAIAAAAPIFVFWPGKANPCDARRSAFSQLLAWFTALLALSSAWTGIAAHLYGDDPRLELAATRLGLMMLAATLTLATAQSWRGGTLAALDLLARKPVFAFLATLFSKEKTN